MGIHTYMYRASIEIAFSRNNSHISFILFKTSHFYLR